MHYDLILKNGTIVTPEKSIPGDIAVSGGKIAKVGVLDPSDTADEVYDAAGKHILPGIIDAHVHFRDPGLTEKEDFETGSIAAAFGGITMVADMPNVIPVTSTVERFNEKVNIAREKTFVDFALFALLTDENTDEMEGLKKAGAFGYKVFLGTSTGGITAPSAKTMLEQMARAADLGVRIGFHAETNEINSNFTSIAMSETNSPDGFWLDYARPVMSEANAINNILYYAENIKAKIHIHHITSSDGLLLAAEGRQKGIDITIETCPHYLILDQERAYKVYPPIRDESHRDDLWDAVGKGVIDMLATDHAPHTASEKALPLWDAPAGLCGVETFVPLLLNEVNKGRLTINDFVRLASERPAKIWGIFPKKGSLESGADADFTIVDMNMKRKISAADLHSKNKLSPYDGMEVQGNPVATIVRGKFIMKNNELTGQKGYGILVSPLSSVS